MTQNDVSLVQSDVKNIHGVASPINSLFSAIKIVKMLLDAGADPNKINQYSKKPLDYAINSGNKELISLLLPLTKM